MSRHRSSLVAHLLIAAALAMIGGGFASLFSYPAALAQTYSPALCSPSGAPAGCGSCTAPFPPTYGCTAGVPQYRQLGSCVVWGAGSCTEWAAYNCGVGIQCGSNYPAMNYCNPSTTLCR